MKPARLISLTQGKVAIVDAEDYERLSKLKWQALRVGPTGPYYAVHSVRTNGKVSKVRMHRMIMDCPPDREVHHIDAAPTLDNRKENLEKCTRKENMRYRHGKR